jgi:hypothetical protein
MVSGPDIMDQDNEDLVHEEDRQRFQCFICKGTSFSCLDTLQRHVRRKHNILKGHQSYPKAQHFRSAPAQVNNEEDSEYGQGLEELHVEAIITVEPGKDCLLGGTGDKAGAGAVH